MTNFQKIALAASRIALGWMFFYAGITKILSGNLFLNPQILPAVNFLNEWGLTLVGVSLILGIFTRLGSIVGAGLLMLYYFPVLGPLPEGIITPLSGYFPFNLGLYPDTHSFIVDSHILEALAVLVVGALKAGRVFGLENWCANLPLCRRWYETRSWLG